MSKKKGKQNSESVDKSNECGNRIYIYLQEIVADTVGNSFNVDQWD